MTGRFLYPRLPGAQALALINDYAETPVHVLRQQGAAAHPSAEFNPVGGVRVPKHHLEELQASLREVADELGFPAELSKTGEFDRYTMRVLYEQMDIVPADAASEGVWSFVSLVLVPEIAPWRFPGRSEERLRGQPRNTFRRLWWRGHILGAGQTDCAWHLSEDQLVQVMERPTISGDPTVARQLCAAFAAVSCAYPHVRSESLMREGAKRLIRLTPFMSVGALRGEELHALLEEILKAAAEAISGKTPASVAQGRGASVDPEEAQGAVGLGGRDAAVAEGRGSASTQSDAGEISDAQYVNWTPVELPDPAKADSEELVPGLLEIIRCEGPMTSSRAFHLFVRAAGRERLGKQSRRALRAALRVARSQQKIEERIERRDPKNRESIVRWAGSARVVVRPRGSRSLSEIPPSELATVMARLEYLDPTLHAGALYRKVLGFYGLKRMGRRSVRQLQHIDANRANLM